MGWRDGFSFALSEEAKQIQEAVRDFAEREVTPLAAKIDREHYFPQELVRPLCDLGLFGALVPASLGGSEISTIAYCLAIEELAAACASTAIIVSAHNSLCVWPIVEYGTEAQHARFLPRLASGTIGCFALSEPGTGSDAGALKCMARRDGAHYVINGTKNWITNGPVAGVCVLFASEAPEKGNKGVTAFVHDMDLKGISVGRKEDKLGICGSPTASITYDEVRLPAESILFKPEGGFRVAMTTLNGGRLGVASQAIGIARAALRDALAYAKERKTFGKPIAEHGSIQNYLADIVTKIDASRYLCLGAATLKDSGADFSRQAAMAKLFASETAVFAADKAVQIHGGYGYVKDFPVERHLRDAKITEIYEGTTEIQRIIIASGLVKEGE